MPPEKLELWRRNPERVYHDKEGKIRVYDEMWTGDWWWDTQVRYSIACEKPMD
jgi:hypothetical protein